MEEGAVVAVEECWAVGEEPKDQEDWVEIVKEDPPWTGEGVTLEVIKEEAQQELGRETSEDSPPPILGKQRLVGRKENQSHGKTQLPPGILRDPSQRVWEPSMR